MHDKQGGCCGGCAGGCCKQREIILSEDEKQFLSLLAETPFLPVVKFLIKSTKSDHIESVALAPVYLTSINDSMETVKKTGKVIESLEKYNIISLDYDILLENCDYSDYERSDVYNCLKETVAQGRTNPDFIFDSAALEFGSIALTGTGQNVIDEMSE